MSRNNIFQRVKDNYNPNKEIEKIYDNLTNYTMFCRYRKNKYGTTEEFLEDFKFFDCCERYLFEFMPDVNTCLTIDEFMEYADADLKFGRSFNLTEERIINFLEVIENIFKIYFDRMRYFKRRYGLDYYIDEYEETRFLIDTLEKHLNLTKANYKDRVILYVGNAKLDKAVEQIQSSDMALELIKYDNKTSNHIEKRKVLKQLDVLVEPIIDKLKTKYNKSKNTIYYIADDLGCIYNNFDLRHNNSDKTSNDYIENVSKLSDNDFCEIYDCAYDLIIDILIINNYEETLESKIKSIKQYLK
jgi:hypothetical protein